MKMKFLFLRITCAIYVLFKNSAGIELIDKSKKEVDPSDSQQSRRNWLKTFGDYSAKKAARQAGYTDEKDEHLKLKISTLVDQTIYDTDRKIKMIQPQKDYNRRKLPYKIGFILSMVKKTRDILNELFNDAVKHRQEWKALEQLKMYELIVHTNVDTTNLVRQLVELHIQNLNHTQSQNGRRVVLI